MYALLIFNAGSSSLKYTLFEATDASQKKLKEVFKGHIDNHGKQIEKFDILVKQAIAEAQAHTALPITCVGHRVVHGGKIFEQPTRITAQVLANIQKLFTLAPLHNPANYAVIVAAQKLLPKASHIAVFDTGFHATMPVYARRYAIAPQLAQMGVERFGFHGISHSYVFSVARKKLGTQKTKRTVTCHLGNGCSVAAIQDGKVVDTSMGFTPLEGIPMGTRSGDVDAGIIFHAVRAGIPLNEVERLLLKESGLKGLSGFSGDVRDLRAAMLSKKKDKNALAKKTAARSALMVFAYRIAKYIGSYATIMGGLDCVIFTGGTGENAWYLRKMIQGFIKPFKTAKMLVVPTNEELKIAEECMQILKK